MKNTLKSIVVLVVLLAVVPSVFALTPLRREIKNTIRETVKEGKKESSSQANTNKDAKEIRMGLLDKVKNFMKKNLKFEARVKGKITVVGSNNFSLSGEDGTFQVNITDKTQILRKFGGKSSLSEYSVGDEVVVFGKFTDDTKLTIDAKTIKNNSIQKRWGAFFGKVTSHNSDNFILFFFAFFFIFSFISCLIVVGLKPFSLPSSTVSLIVFLISFFKGFKASAEEVNDKNIARTIIFKDIFFIFVFLFINFITL